MKRILITDTIFPKNRGDNAILLGMIEDIKNKITDVEFIVLSSYPQDAENKLPYQVYPSMSSLLGYPPFSLIKIIIILIMVNLPKLPAFRTIEEYRKADIVISCGGSFVTDTYLISLYKVLFGYFISKKLKKPLVLYAQSIGPFRFSFYKKLTLWILNMVDLIITRDSRSYEMVKHLDTEVHSSVDAALNLPAVKENMFETESIPNNKFVVGISTREWVYPGVQNPTEQIVQYKAVIAKIADYLIERYDAHIVFASTCFGEGTYKFNDVETSVQIQKLMKNQNDTNIITKPYSASELKKLFGEMNFCICTRMHTLIFATTMYIPSVAIQYEFKTNEYMKMLDLDKYVIDIVDIKYEKLRHIVDEALDNIENIGEKLNKQIPALKQKSESNVKYIAKLLKI